MILDTLAAPASHEIEVKRSRFRANAATVPDPGAAQAWLQQAAVADATHNCWAWRIGEQYRSSDDGEPAGTAGRPILAAIEGQGFDHVAVVVTRWYGGIKLGAGGLVRAYGGAAAECLRRAERHPLIERAALTLRVPFADLGAVHAALETYRAEKLDEGFGPEGGVFRLRLPLAQVDAIKSHLREATRDRVRFDRVDSEPRGA